MAVVVGFIPNHNRHDSTRAVFAGSQGTTAEHVPPLHASKNKNGGNRKRGGNGRRKCGSVGTAGNQGTTSGLAQRKQRTRQGLPASSERRGSAGTAGNLGTTSGLAQPKKGRSWTRQPHCR